MQVKLKHRLHLNWRGYATILVLVISSVFNVACSIFGPHEKRALARVLPTMGQTARGMVTFAQRADGVQITYNIARLPSNKNYGFQLHERGDCNAMDASSAGDIFDPDHQREIRGARAAGQLPNIYADANGVATGFIIAPDLALDGIRSVIGRAIIVLQVGQETNDADAGVDTTVAARANAPRLACGVIQK